MINTNAWNRIRYTLYQPVYDRVVKVFAGYREKSIRSLQLSPADHILILGAGTGLDLEYLSGFKNITAIDITPAMISRLQQRAERLGLEVDARVMDGSNLEFDDASFDAIILHLIVAVIPDPVGCLREAERVLKPGGKLSIMDKFVPSGHQPGVLRRALSFISNIIATNLNRDIDQLLAQTSLHKKRHEKLGSIFWLINAEKPA